MPTEIKMNKAIVRRVDEKIIEIDYISDSNFELEDAIKANDAYYKISKRKPFASLIDARHKYGNITNEARVHYVTDEKTKTIRLAEAIVINNLPAKIIANFYIRYNKPSNPVKIFSKREDAINWLHKKYNNHFNINT
jgi:hypothetical protein